MNLAALALAVALAAPPRAAPRVTVLDLELGAGVTGIDRSSLTDVLLTAMADREAWQLVTVRDVGKLLGLERQKELLGCKGDACVAELAGGLGGDGVVISTVGIVGGTLVASGRVIRPSGAVLAQATAAAAGGDLVSAVRRVGKQLLASWREVRGLGKGKGKGRDCESAAECEEECAAGVTEACVRAGALIAAAAPDPARAARALETACDRGDAAACASAADAWARAGRSDRAAELRGRACLSLEGAPAACALGGSALLRGEGLPAAPAQGAAMLELACAGGVTRSCLELAEALTAGVAMARDEGRAAQLYGTACTAGDGAGCRRLGDLAAGRRGGGEAAMAYEKACGLGQDDACRQAGEALEASGQAGEAVPLYERACRGSGPEAHRACSALAQLRSRPGPEQRPAEEAGWRRLACEKGGGTEACTAAVRVLAQPGSRDPAGAAALVDRSCAAGASGCAEVARAALAAAGEPRDVGGLRLLEAGCAAGEESACRRAAVLQRRGAFGPAGPERADELEVAWCRLVPGDACLDRARELERGPDGDSAGAGPHGPERVVRTAPAGAAVATRMLESGCGAGQAVACGAIADRALEAGDADPARMAALLGRACSSGHARSCALLALRVDAGRGVPEDRARADQLHEDACRLGDCRLAPGLAIGAGYLAWRNSFLISSSSAGDHDVAGNGGGAQLSVVYRARRAVVGLRALYGLATTYSDSYVRSTGSPSADSASIMQAQLGLLAGAGWYSAGGTARFDLLAEGGLFRYDHSSSGKKGDIPFLGAVAGVSFTGWRLQPGAWLWFSKPLADFSWNDGTTLVTYRHSRGFTVGASLRFEWKI